MSDEKMTIDDFMKNLEGYDQDLKDLQDKLVKKWEDANKVRKKKGKAENKEKPKITNIYACNEGGLGEIRRNNLRFYLETMQTLHPSRLFVGEAPGINGCFWTGIPFTDMETLIGNKFFQKRKKELVDSILGKEFKRKEIEELKNFIISYCKDKKDDIEKIFRNNSFEKRKEELKKSINDYYKNKGIKKRVALVCSIINLHKEKEIKFEIEEIKERVELVCSIIDSCKEDGLMVNDISESTSSTVWECLDQLCEKGFMLPLLWNIFPFHPGKETEEGIKNRNPTPEECKIGIKFLFDLLKLFNIKQICPVGKNAEKTLPQIFHSLRHPARYCLHELNQNFSPKENAATVDSSKEGSRVLTVSCGYTSPSL